MKKSVNSDFIDFSDELGGKVQALFSLASSGDMKNEEVRAAFIRQHFRQAKFVYAEQVHRTNIGFVDFKILSPVPETDALITNDKNIVMGVFTADCIPVYFNDPITGYAGIIHAGWRGVSSNIIISALENIRKNYPIDLTSIKIVIGPGICTKHFEFSAELAHMFPEIFVKKKKGKCFADLKKIIKTQFIDSGVKSKNIYDSRICSFEEKNIFSHRRDVTAARNCAFLKIL